MSGKPLDIFRDADSVRWYRGLSSSQTEACEKLLYALRDDSVYRVLSSLSHLGLYPLVEPPQVKAIMRISQGSDLAFLWFLWEAAYKQPRDNYEDIDPTPYTVNEQLLLSGIAHLDMPATLRALEILLPPACLSKKSSLQSCVRLKKNPVRASQPGHREQGGQPYFDRLVRPRAVPVMGKYRPPDRKLEFPDYSQFIDRLGKIRNEQCRWFAEYQLCPEKRVIKNLLSEELNRLLSSPSPGEAGELCETHRHIEKIEIRQREEKANEVFLRCLAQLDVPGAELKARRKAILADLEREVERAADKIRADSQRLLQQVKIIRNEAGSRSCQLCNSMVSIPRPRADLSILIMGQGDGDMPRISRCNQQDDQVKVMQLKLRDKPNRCGGGDCKFFKSDDILRRGRHVNLDPRSIQRSTLKLNVSRISLSKGHRGSLAKSNEDLPVEQPTITTEMLADRIPFCSRTLPCLISKRIRSSESKTFIKRTVDGFSLDYNKIFDLPGIPEEHMPLEDPEYVDVEDKQPVIEKLCIAALNEGQSKAVKELRQDETLSPVLRAADSCAVDMFRTQLAEAKKNIEEKENDIKEKKDVLIDPNNKQQIEDILKAALQILRANPHYVLATFPNAHKWPVLLDWVADRYGKTITQEEMDALGKSTVDIYKQITQDNQDPLREYLRFKKGMMELGGEPTYPNIKSFMCIRRQQVGKYHRKLNGLALEQARLIWMALRGYSNLGGRIKDTFFAYMPAREIDLQREFVWRYSDYRNMVQSRRDVEHRNRLKGSF